MEIESEIGYDFMLPSIDTILPDIDLQFEYSKKRKMEIIDEDILTASAKLQNKISKRRKNNAIHAITSRQNMKRRQSELEDYQKMLAARHSELEHTVISLRAHNITLKEQLLNIKELINNSPFLRRAFPEGQL